MKSTQQTETDRHDDRRVPICLLAPEWAEHARLEEDPDACDDGRAAVSCGRRAGETPCPIG